MVIDEAAQAPESNCWIAALKGKRLLLAGDSFQLGPVIKSKEAEKRGLGETLFQRIMEKFPGNQVTRMLSIQYRMNELIMNWPSAELYQNKLAADESVRFHLLSDSPTIATNDTTNCPLVFIDTCGCGLEEAEASSLMDSESKSNQGEADVTVDYLENLISCTNCVCLIS